MRYNNLPSQIVMGAVGGRVGDAQVFKGRLQPVPGKIKLGHEEVPRTKPCCSINRGPVVGVSHCDFTLVAPSLPKWRARSVLALPKGVGFLVILSGFSYAAQELRALFTSVNDEWLAPGMVSSKKTALEGAGREAREARVR